MGNELIELIENIDQSQLVAECDVLSALSDTYQKALMISEQCDNASVFSDLLFMEAKDETRYFDDNGKEVEAPRPIRSQNIIAKIIRLIKRIWQRILTMISAATTNATVNKLKSYIKHASTDKVPSPYELKTLEFYTKLHDQLVEVDSQSLEHSPSGFVAHLKSAKARIEQVKRINPEDAARKLGTTEFVPKEAMLKYLDSYQNYLDTLKNCAKQIDKYLDKHYKTDGSTVHNYETLTAEDKAKGITSRFTKAELSEEEIQMLNNASTILFEQLRQEMAMLKTKAQHITDQFTKTKQPGIALVESISMKDIKNGVQQLLMGAKTNKSTKDYSVVVIDGSTKDPDSQKVIAPYKDIMRPEPNYSYVIGMFLVELKTGNVKNWRVLKSDTVHGNVRLQLGDEGTFIVKN